MWVVMTTYGSAMYEKQLAVKYKQNLDISNDLLHIFQTVVLDTARGAGSNVRRRGQPRAFYHSDSSFLCLDMFKILLTKLMKGISAFFVYE